jgi:hypothetical protein
MTTEEWLWSKLEAARVARKQVEALPRDTKMLTAIIALSNHGVIEAADAWKAHITRS